MMLDQQRMRDLKVGFPNLPDVCIEHGLNAVENNQIGSIDLSYYLRFLDVYFVEKGDVRKGGYDLLPENPEDFLNERLQGFKSFWSGAF